VMSQGTPGFDVAAKHHDVTMSRTMGQTDR
jgi:hypothetical protein